MQNLMENKTHIEYIDVIKGFAIFLVVLGHMIAWNLPSWEDALTTCPKSMFWWSVIYSFHMPLFFFISGFLYHPFAKGAVYLKKYICSRFCTLVIPFFTIGVIAFLLSGKYSFSAWFLRTLFEMIVINLLLEFIIYECREKSIFLKVFIEILYYLIVFRLLQMSSTRLSGTNWFNIIDFGHLACNNYLAFCFGAFFHRYRYLQHLADKNIIFTISLCMFVFLYWNQYVHYFNYSIWFLPSALIPISAIICVWYFFKNECKFRFFNKIFSLLGRRSLEIYLLHWYFQIIIPSLGFDYIHVLSNTDQYGMQIGVINLYLVLMIIVSIVVILGTLMLRKIISTSNILSFLILGRRKNN
jgi:fucose 4-O-acetylase-like acetyltransferase